jgi:hypothetical protein
MKDRSMGHINGCRLQSLGCKATGPQESFSGGKPGPTPIISKHKPAAIHTRWRHSALWARPSPCRVPGFKSLGPCAFVLQHFLSFCDYLGWSVALKPLTSLVRNDACVAHRFLSQHANTHVNPLEQILPKKRGEYMGSHITWGSYDNLQPAGSVIKSIWPSMSHL